LIAGATAGDWTAYGPAAQRGLPLVAGGASPARVLPVVATVARAPDRERENRVNRHRQLLSVKHLSTVARRGGRVQSVSFNARLKRRQVERSSTTLGAPALVTGAECPAH
jgi:hypothetical protein